MSRVGWLIIAVIVLIGAGLIYESQHIEWVEKDIGQFFTQTANKQPYLAADQFLQQYGLSVKHEQGFRRLDEPDGDLLILVNAYGMLSERRAQALLDWVHGGGQLIMAAENPFTELHRKVRDPIFDQFNVGISTEKETEPAMALSPDCSKLSEPKPIHFNNDIGDLDIAMASDVRLIRPQASGAALDEGVRLLQYNWGQGGVTLLAGTAIWRNDFIGCNDHAYLLWQLSPWEGTVWFLENRQGPSVWRLLWRHGAPAVVLLIVLVGAMLWARGVRMGAVREPHRVERRRLMEHVEATGWFLWRQRQKEPLLRPLRQAIMHQIEKREPGFSDLPAKTRYARLASLLDLPASAIEQALSGKPRNESEFVATVALLRQIRTGL